MKLSKISLGMYIHRSTPVTYFSFAKNRFPASSVGSLTHISTVDLG